MRAYALLHSVYGLGLCTRHEPIFTDSGGCLGCAVEHERENISWWTDSAHYTDVPASVEAQAHLQRHVAELCERVSVTRIRAAR